MTEQETLYEKIYSDELHPPKQDWYDTDKGSLYWFEEESVWSCRDDRVSEEYPRCFYLIKKVSSTKQLQSEITQLKEVNETCYQSNKMLEEKLATVLADGFIQEMKILELKSKLEVAEKALQEEKLLEYDKGYESGYSEAQKEAIKEIRENYKPNH